MSDNTSEARSKLIAERKKINAKPKPTAADKKRLEVIAAEIDGLKADAFKRLGAMRTTKAINAMRGLQKLANTANYVYTQEQADKIVKALKSEVEGVFNAFNTKGETAEEEFTL